MAIDVKELMAKVGRIRILTNRLIDDQLSGDYHSTFKGQGVEFDEVRPYVPGDDVRTIDWNVTAKTGVPHIKRFADFKRFTDRRYFVFNLGLLRCAAAASELARLNCISQKVARVGFFVIVINNCKVVVSILCRVRVNHNVVYTV